MDYRFLRSAYFFLRYCKNHPLSCLVSAFEMLSVVLSCLVERRVLRFCRLSIRRKCESLLLPLSPFVLYSEGEKIGKGLIFRFSVTPWPLLRIMGPADKRNKLQYFVSCHPFFCITHSARWRDTDFKATILQNIECKILIYVILATLTIKNMFHRLCILDDLAFSFKLLMEIVNRWWASRNSYHIETSKLSQQLLSVGTTSIKCSRNLVLCSARHAKPFLRNIQQD